MVSERHVLTAAHTVRCPIIPTVHVTLQDGRVFPVSVERDDAMFGAGADIARLEISSAEHFGIGIPPPALGTLDDADIAATTLCAAFIHGESCGSVVGRTPGEVIFHAPTHVGHSGSPVYDEFGRLDGIVTQGGGGYTKAALVGAYWLGGT